MPLWVSDFLGDTLDLDAKEVGAFMLLLMAMWQRGGSIPSDEKTLKRVSRTGRDWPRIWERIGRFFVDNDGQLSNKRLTLELQKVVTKREVNAQLGALGGRAKYLKSKETALANGSNSLKQPEPYPLEDDKSSSRRDVVGEKLAEIIRKKREKQNGLHQQN
jgi:uncharacterized protein YdaU (DUF1376 family)